MKMRFLKFFLLTLLTGCIGVDDLKDPIVGERIEVSIRQVALMPTESVQLNADYFNIYGVKEDLQLTWTSSASQIASVDENGVLSGNAPGQAVITVAYQTAVSQAVNVTVVADENTVASVVINGPPVILEVGEKKLLSADVKNINGEILAGRSVQWFSENPTILTVNDAGEVTAISNGIAGVHAKSENVKSNAIEFVIGSSRQGSFVSSGGYNTEGVASLTLLNGNILLELSDNFKTSFALGTFVYLSNTTSGSATFSTGLELGQITTNGKKSFNVTSIAPTVGLFDYRYVIILCKPARINFGFADMN